MRQERIQLGQDVAALLTGSDYLFFVTYKGLKVKDVDSFKKQLAPLGAECHVLKNRFINKMAEPPLKPKVFSPPRAAISMAKS